MKRLAVFDLDGTLAESKTPVDIEMADLLARLLAVCRTAVISGGSWNQFHTQFLSQLPRIDLLANLSILPTCGTQFYEYNGSWQRLYEEDFSPAERDKIIAAIHSGVKQSGMEFPQLWGEQIEDRGSQITFSALGQQAPLDAKEKWDPDFDKRKQIKKLVEPALAGFSVRIGGATSIDITKPGIDKAYGIHKLKAILGVPIEEMLYVGDALFEGGNDFPVKSTGIDTVQVRDSHETKRVIETFMACTEPSVPAMKAPVTP